MAKQGSTPNPPSTKENTPTISVLHFDEFQTALRNSFESTAFATHPTLLIHTGNAPKPTEYQAAGEDLAKSNKQAFYVGKPSGKNQILSQSLLGIDSKDVQCKWILLGPAAIETLKATKEIPNSLFELYYLLEKTTLQYHTYELSSTATQDSFKSTFSTWWSACTNYYLKGNKNIHRWAFMIISLIAVIFMTQMSKTASVSGDEFTQYTYSKLIANYYLEPLGMGIPVDTNELKGQRMPTLAKALPEMGSQIATIKDPDRVMHVYGSSFDTFTTVLGHWMGVEDYMGFRHWWNAIFGFACILYMSLIVRRLTGGSWLFAWVSFLVMLFMPRFFGEAMNNPKDVPFALGYIMSLYYAIKMFQNWPHFSWSSAFGLVLGTGLGISVRIGGLLSIAIFAMYAGLKFIERIGLKNFFSFKWTGIAKLITAIVIMGFSAYIAGIAPWPYGWDQPFTNPMEALKEFTNYSVSLRQLFEGKLFDSDMLPLYYLRKYLTITTPLSVIAGSAIFVLLLYPNRKKFSNEMFLILFAAIFPIVYIYIQKSQVYGGIRQILFTLPCFVVIAMVGFYWLDQWLTAKNSKIKGLIATVILIATAAPANFIFANHPVSYSYFNEIHGGTKTAYGEYEMDYYLASLRPSTEWFLENVARKNPNKKYEVLSYGMDHVKYYCRNDKNVHVGYSRYDDRSTKKWDYCIFYNAYFDKARLNSGEFPPKGTVYAQMVDGVPAGVVIQRPIVENSNLPYQSSDPNFALMMDYEGIKAIEKDTAFEKGIALLKEYLKIDPNRSEIHFYLSTAYANLGQIENAIASAEKARTFYPEHSRSCFALHQYYVNMKQYDKAIQVMTEFIDSRPRDGEGYVMKAQAQLMKGDAMSGIATLQEAVGVNPMDYRVYGLGAQAFQMQKDVTNYNLWVQAANIGSARTQMDFQVAVEAIMTIYQEITGKELDTKKYGIQ